MNIRSPIDGRRHAATLVLAATISIALWFLPFAGFLTYPFRLFVTFVHEGGHAVAALLTGNSVQSLAVAVNASGETYTTHGGIVSQMVISSAGYLGAMAFGAVLLGLLRTPVAARAVLAACAAVVLCLTAVFGLIEPIMSAGTLAGIPFTVVAGIALSAGLVAIARYANVRVAAFFVSLLAVQCVLNACLDLETLLVLSSSFSTSAQTDAQNMANATHVPAIVWTVVWIAASVGILGLALRPYLAQRRPPSHA